MDKLRSALEQLQKSDMYPFHMPGHKRREIDYLTQSSYLKDITEIDGFDNLHCPEGIIKEEQEFAASLFGAKESFFLINGSSVGVLAAIAAAKDSDSEKKILMGRNSHKSAYNGLYLWDIRAEYLYPRQYRGVSFVGAISVKEVERALSKSNDYGAVFITSPTYEGIISDIKGICELAHQKDIPVIVDEAHGAHLGIFGGDDYFPLGAIASGADVVIQSLHKTLPSLTQTAVLHIQGDLVDVKKIKSRLSMLQSSSPSYILMESISACLHACDEYREDYRNHYKSRLQSFYKEMKSLSRLKLLTNETLDKGQAEETMKDPGKILIHVGSSGLNGRQLYDILRERYHLQMEMAAVDYVIAMTSFADDEEGFLRLETALKEIDQEASGSERGHLISMEFDRPEAVYTIRQALEAEKEQVPLSESIGRISGEFLYFYPPGIPFLVPGERIGETVPDLAREAKNNGLILQGTEDSLQKQILCIK
ncbi:MAG: aminotransferase class I/II-fold pyridoxal phosphate-dependent enzyme [Lachnospiraceae bacterium]|nr:aminotransferase class I/II-fold pyridoxal phosphate-dependent enzyme [Lachnospiraceae bacterium]